MTGLKNATEKKKHMTPGGYDSLTIKTVDFNNPYNCSHCKPCSFVFNGIKYTVESWIELYTKFLSILYNDNAYGFVLKSLIGKSVYGDNIDFTDAAHSHALRRPIKISSDFYAERNLSAIQIIRRIKGLMVLCSIDDEHMIIEYGTKETDNSYTETKKYLITSPAQESTVSDDKSENHESSCFKIPKPLVTESNAQTESADIRNNDVPAPAKFTPNTSKPFELKNAIIEIMSSDAPEITSHYEYNNGFSSNVLCNLIKTYYGKAVDRFDLSILIINDKAFKSVGKCCYTLSEAAAANIEEPIEKIAENVYVDETPFRREYDVIDNSNTIAEETLKTDTIIDVIRENSDNLQYEEGFGSYEVKNLLFNKGISNVSEEQIEALMSQCPELQEIEEGYYILAEENSINETPADQTADIEIIPENEVAERIQTETIPEESFSLNADTKHIILKLNGNTIRAFDHTDALKKICEFSINCKPFRMARIANKGITLHGNNAFYRKAVPIDGYNKLSNGLQIIKIDSIDDLKFITEEIKKYCRISDDMITIVSKQGDK